MLNQLNTYKTQFSKEQCMGGPYCSGYAQLPYPSIGNRTLEAALKLYSNSTMQTNTHYLWFRFFDANTNQTLHHVSFLLTITNQNLLLFRELLHTHTGTLILQLNSINGTFNSTVVGDREPILNGWVPHDDNTPLMVSAPVFNDTNSTYHFLEQMFSIDRDNNIFYTTDIPNSNPTFDFYLSVRDKNQTIISPDMSVSYSRDVITPLKQLQEGIQAQNVKCDWSGFQLILKSEDGSPACVDPYTAHTLIERGWARNPLVKLPILSIQNHTKNKSSFDVSSENQKLINLTKNLIQVQEILQKYPDATANVLSRSDGTLQNNDVSMSVKNIVEYTITRVLHPQEETRQLSFSVYFDYDDKIIETIVSCGGHIGTTSPNPSQYVMDMCFSIIPS